ADDLVERVTGEARGAARLREAHGPFGVARGRGGEDEAGDDEDDRRQAERVGGGQPKRVVDRRADVAVGGREEGRRAEHALESLLLAASPARHGRTLVAKRVGARQGLPAARADRCGWR